MNKKITLITGGNKGMGFEMARELGHAGQYILIGARNENLGTEAVSKLIAEGIECETIQIDVTDSNSIQKSAKYIKNKFGHLDILINNAGIALDNYQKPSTLSLEIIRKDFDVNFFGLIDITQNMIPLLRQAVSAKIINISSAVGSLTMASDSTTSIYQHSAVGYQSSKTAVNMFTVDLANELKTTNVTVNAVNPGWVNTTFAGGGGDKSVQEGIARTIELATAATNAINGTFSDINGIVPW